MFRMIVLNGREEAIHLQKQRIQLRLAGAVTSANDAEALEEQQRAQFAG